jgi:hypothetical protein
MERDAHSVFTTRILDVERGRREDGINKCLFGAIFTRRID